MPWRLRLTATRKRAANFLPFAKNAHGGLYAFWLYEGRRCAEAPIAYLDSEGIGNGVVENVQELLSLVATGTEPYYWLRGERNSAPEDVAAFRAWLGEELHIAPADDPEAVVRRAQSRHRDLEGVIDRAP